MVRSAKASCSKATLQPSSVPGFLNQLQQTLRGVGIAPRLALGSPSSASIRNRSKNRIQNLIQALADVLGEESEHQIAIFLQ